MDDLNKEKMTKVTKINQVNKIESKYLNTRKIINDLFGNSKLATKVYIFLVSIVQSDLKRDKNNFNDTKEKLADIIVNINNEEEYLKFGAYLNTLANYGGYAYIFFNKYSFMFDKTKISKLKIEIPNENKKETFESNVNSVVNKSVNSNSNNVNEIYFDNFVKKYLLAIEKYNKFLMVTSYKMEELEEDLNLFKELEKEVGLLKNIIDRNKYLEYAISIDEKKFDIEMLISGLCDSVNLDDKKKITKKLS